MVSKRRLDEKFLDRDITHTLYLCSESAAMYELTNAYDKVVGYDVFGLNNLKRRPRNEGGSLYPPDVDFLIHNNARTFQTLAMTGGIEKDDAILYFKFLNEGL